LGIWGYFWLVNGLCFTLYANCTQAYSLLLAMRNLQLSFLCKTQYCNTVFKSKIQQPLL